MLEAIVIAADILAAGVFLFFTNPPDRARLTGAYSRLVTPHRKARNHAL